MLRRLRGRLIDERGVTLVMVAITLPVLILFVGFVIDLGTWWAHKRHLQVQADAAALAGATEFRIPCDGSTDALIERRAIEYSGGVDLRDNPSIVPQFNFMRGTADKQDPVRTEIQEPSFWRDEGVIVDNDLLSRPSPCAAKFVDVKMTEEDSPGFFVRSLIPEIDAQARVALQRLGGTAGVIPLGVEEVNPEQVHVWFWNEATSPSTLLGDRRLYKTAGGGVSGGLLTWSNSIADGGTPLDIADARNKKIGVTVALSGSKTPIPDGTPFATACTMQLVLCYGATDAGLSRIRAYERPATTPAAGIGEVTISGGTCNAARDNGYFWTSCDGVIIRSEIWEGATDNTEDFRLEIEGVKNPVQLTRSGTCAAPCQSSFLWSSGLVTLTPDDGIHRISVWQTKGTRAGAPAGTCNTTGNKLPTDTRCRLESNLHATYSGGRSKAGSIKLLEIERIGDAPKRNNISCTTGVVCPAALKITLGLEGRLALSKPNDNPVPLRIFRDVATDGALTQQLDCDFQDYQDPAEPNARDVREEFARGCRSNYALNTGTACPNNVNDLPPYPAQLQCVPVKTGRRNTQPADGLNMRILCLPANSVGNCPPPQNDKPAVCTNPNRWDKTRGQASIAEDDPRIVPVFLVPYGSFDPNANWVGNGTGTVPVVDFAFFYVTAWAGNGGSKNPCSTFSGDPANGTYADDPPDANGDQGAIYGHFMKYISPNLGGGTGDTCDFDSIGGCVAVMTK